MQDSRWIRFGGVAGVTYVVTAVVGAALPGAPPPADGRAATYQGYFAEKHDMLVAQGWMYTLGIPLLLMFAVAVSQLLRNANKDKYLGELFLVGVTVMAALLLVTMPMQIAVAQAAERLDAEVIYTVGVHFGAIVVGLWGFVTAMTALAYSVSVFSSTILPRWTAYLAILTSAVCVFSTIGVFFRSGPLSLEGGFGAWAPAATTVLWYLGTSVAMIRLPTTSPAAE
jgi:hypothetical protein